ncbi:MAG: HAD-IA family hydrolase [Firmicutes bacterium]|nr:HAD-IA family hydrolase [Bacillota bacterium]
MIIETWFIDVGGVILLPNSAYWDTLKERYQAPETVESLFYGVESPWAECRTGIINRQTYNERMARQLNMEVEALEALRWQSEWIRNDALVSWIRTHRHQPRRVVAVSNADDWLERQLEHFGVGDLFDTVINSWRVGAAKPDRAIYERALEAARTVPDRCLFIDDRESNLVTASELGMHTLLYTTFSDFLHQVTEFVN